MFINSFPYLEKESC